MKMRLIDKFKALELRRQGKTYSEIRTLIPNLSKGTLCGWVKNIELTKQQERKILEKIRKGSDRARAIQRQRGAWTNHLKRVAQTKRVVTEAKKEVLNLSKNPLFLLGIMLYWAEGDKSLDRQRTSFSNSDPLMIELIMKWFREICHVPEEKFIVTLNIHTLLNKKKMEQYWSKITRVPLSQFYKTIIKPTAYTQRKNVNYCGTCNIRVYDVNLFRKIMTWRIHLLGQFGFNISNAPVAQWIERMFSKH